MDRIEELKKQAKDSPKSLGAKQAYINGLEYELTRAREQLKVAGELNGECLTAIIYMDNHARWRDSIKRNNGELINRLRQTRDDSHEKKLIDPCPNRRYDEVYEAGLKMLDGEEE